MINYKQFSHWSFFPAITDNSDYRNPFRKLTIMRGRDAVNDLILHYLMLRKGEHPLYPDLGLSELIFKPVSEIGEHAFAEFIRKEITDLSYRFGWGIHNVTTYPLELEDETLNTFHIAIEIEFDDNHSTSMTIDYATLSKNQKN